jgi:DNA-binding response OmpR family regulator
MTQRILVAEPSRTLATLVRLTLAGDGVSLEFTTDGRAALEAARRLRPNLVIADAGLPGLDGYDLTEALRAEPTLAGVPVLLTVPDYEHPDAARLARVGVTDVLTKPFERHALLERVRALLADGGPESAAPPAATEPPAPSPAASPAPSPAASPAPAGNLEAMVARIVNDRLAALVAERLPALVEAALTQQLGSRIDAVLDREVPRLVASRAETVIWKVVPEMAEDLIREELARLTEELDA